MIGRLGQLMQNADTPFGLRSRTENRQAEIFFADHLRAGESKQDSSGLDFLEGNRIQFAVSLQGIAQHILMFGKCRRIQILRS